MPEFKIQKPTIEQRRIAAQIPEYLTSETGVVYRIVNWTAETNIDGPTQIKTELHTWPGDIVGEDVGHD